MFYSINYNFADIFIMVFLFVLLLLLWRNSKKSIDSSYMLQQEISERLAEIYLEQKRANKILSIMGNIDLSKVVLEEEQDSDARLYVGNIDYSVKEQDLAKLFAQFGKINLVSIPSNKYTGRGRGFGFVTYYLKKDAENAISLNGTRLRGRQLQVSFAKE